MKRDRGRTRRTDRDLIIVLACMVGSVLASGYVAARLLETSNGTDPTRYERFYASLDR
ncbi:hypothetical protein [Brevundimonas viscosa]|uniref:Uncharacterized protein n=1 Tax=Brevundimonas viscosa TaxID=871741 RepID=A0A1I6S153_9CAUL|nr:hypothetical protein [Brevundimonas viscosa]SFS70646.1 hypothetical protein SAMN05192570_2078 [Brevundimonas viscosa]